MSKITFAVLAIMIALFTSIVGGCVSGNGYTPSWSGQYVLPKMEVIKSWSGDYVLPKRGIE